MPGTRLWSLAKHHLSDRRLSKAVLCAFIEVNYFDVAY
jgi:hypothetical protein